MGADVSVAARDVDAVVGTLRVSVAQEHAAWGLSCVRPPQYDRNKGQITTVLGVLLKDCVCVTDWPISLFLDVADKAAFLEALAAMPNTPSSLLPHHKHNVLLLKKQTIFGRQLHQAFQQARIGRVYVVQFGMK